MKQEHDGRGKPPHNGYEHYEQPKKVNKHASYELLVPRQEYVVHPVGGGPTLRHLKLLKLLHITKQNIQLSQQQDAVALEVEGQAGDGEDWGDVHCQIQVAGIVTPPEGERVEAHLLEAAGPRVLVPSFCHIDG